MILESQRTELRRIQISDYENMRELESDPLVMKFVPFKVPQTEQQTRNRLEQQISKLIADEPFGIWVAELKRDSSFIGWFMLRPVSEGELELGFMIVQTKWGQGLTTEISQTLVNFARRHPKIEKLTAKTNIENIASMKVLEKTGFKFKETISIPEKGDQIKIHVFNLPLK
jgi:RimJ/RimL family protein N-acetyltransferase